MAIEEAVEAMIDAGLKLDKKQAVELIYELYKEKGMEDQEKHYYRGETFQL